VRVVGDALDRVEKESKQPKEQPLRLMSGAASVMA